MNSPKPTSPKADAPAEVRERWTDVPTASVRIRLKEAESLGIHVSPQRPQETNKDYAKRISDALVQPVIVAATGSALHEYVSENFPSQEIAQPAAPQPSKAQAPLGAPDKDDEAIYQAVHKAHRQAQPAKAAQEWTPEEVSKRHQCDCEVCSHSAVICPATASSLILEVSQLGAELERVKAERDSAQLAFSKLAQAHDTVLDERDGLLAALKLINKLSPCDIALSAITRSSGMSRAERRSK